MSTQTHSDAPDTLRFRIYDPIHVFSQFVRNANDYEGRTLRADLPTASSETLVSLGELEALDFSESSLSTTGPIVDGSAPESEELDSTDLELLSSDDLERFADNTGLTNIIHVEAVRGPEISVQQLVNAFDEMQVLLRYGQKREVQRRLDGLLSGFPDDLLLHRQVAEFYVANGNTRGGVDTLFKLASALFRRKNRKALSQVVIQILKLSPENPQALRLQELLGKTF